HLVREFERTEHVVGVGERQRGLAVGRGELAQPRNRQRAFQQGIGRVHMQMDKAGHLTLAILDALRMGGRARALSTAAAVRDEKLRLIPSLFAGPLSSSAATTAALHRIAMTCAQIAIMPKNNANEASVAASSTRARTMITTPHLQEQDMNI